MSNRCATIYNYKLADVRLFTITKFSPRGWRHVIREAPNKLYRAKLRNLFAPLG